MSGAGPSSAPEGDPRSEVGPIPRKIAEFGYVPVEERQQSPNAPAADVELPPHPAERPTGVHSEASANVSNNSVAASVGSSTSSLPSSTNVDGPKKPKVYHTFINFLRGRSSKPIPLIWGIELPTIIRLAFTVVILIGVIVAWALTVVFVAKGQSSSSGTQNGGDGILEPGPANPGPSSNKPSAFGLNQDGIFIHTGFGLVTLILLILLERAVFIARAERYASKRPNVNGRRVGPRGGVALAPWNRPPLPTYANAMGFRGTGDVEDAQIAAPPPPEYGNTRGSVLLLSTVLGSGSGGLQQSGEDENDPRGRPVSYRSHVDVEITIPERAASRLSSLSAQEDARRARRLEEALAALEGSEQSNMNAAPPRALRLVRR